MALPGFTTTDGGLPNSRFRAPVLSGTIVEGSPSTSQPYPIIGVGGFMAVQGFNAVTTAATNAVLNQVVSTQAARAVVASYIYIPQTTGPIATSSFASAESAPPYTSCGAALVWDAGRSKLGVYSTASGSGVWLWSSGAFTSS